MNTNLGIPATPDSEEPGRPTLPPNAPVPEHSGVYVGKVSGIRFYLDYSWFLIAAIAVYILSNNTFPLFLHGRSPGTYLMMGIVATGLFFFSILLHELGHSIVSQRCGIPVPNITLLFIGGVAEISREPDDARSELKIALAGPAVSLMLATAYAVLAWMMGAVRFWEARLVLEWLAIVNVWLVIFNAIPGYPLDGGRVLRAILWMRNGNLRRSTYVTSRIGILFSWVLMAFGIYRGFAYGDIYSLLVFTLIGVFLKGAAESGYSDSVSKEILAGLHVGDLMTRNPVTIPARLPLSLAVENYFLTNHHVAFPVVDEEGHFRGLLRLEYLKSVPRERWPYTSAIEVAEKNDSRDLKVVADSSAATALRTLLLAGQGRLGVTDESERLVGIITRHDLLHFIQIHTELAA